MIMKLGTYYRGIVLFVGIFSCLSIVSANDEPWRINDSLQVPKGVSISGSHQTRFETLDGQYRGTRNGDDQALLFRTLIRAQMDLKRVKFVVELEDSRAELADTGTPLSTSVVNPLELLQAYTEFSVDDFFSSGSKSRMRGGRITMDVGSRRFVARNRFRNTLNAFTGIDLQWTGADNSQFRVFYTLPVQRLVDGSILDNEAKFDKEHEDVSFWGLYYSPSKLPWGDSGEVYLFGLDEEDVAGWATRDRDLYTAGLRLYRKAIKGSFDYQIESAYQWGDSRSSTSSIVDLDHFAHFQHLEIGYTFDAPMSPRLLIQYDYASGDDDPTDGDNNRFDTLYGARRFDFGPTSIYGPFARSNISTPGLRLKLKPAKNITSFFVLRAYWLASSNDAWTTARIANPVGVSEDFVGTQIEVRVRWELIPKNLRIESGVAHLFAGDLMDNANKDDAAYMYTQAVFWF